MEKKVGIILVNYNGFIDTAECVESLRGIDYQNYQIYVVDNNSEQEERDRLFEFQNENNDIHFIYLDCNEGFSAGNNAGIKVAMEQKCDYLLLLNNDTIVEPQFLNKLIEAIEKKENIGIATGNIFLYKDKETLWYSFGSYDRNYGKLNMINPIVGDAYGNVSFVCGCLMLIRKEVIESVGVLDETFFLYTEDTEFCCRVIDDGWTMVCNPQARIYHKVSASAGAISGFQQYYQIRNDLIVAKQYVKHFTLYFILRFIDGISTNIKFKGSISAVFKAYNDFLRKKRGKI